MIHGLPPQEPMRHEREPFPCKRCKHVYFRRDDDAFRYPVCGHSEPNQLCVYERHESGHCGEKATHFKERGT